MIWRIHEWRYLIKWEGYNEDQNTWEPKEALEDMKEDVQNFD